MNDMTLNQTRAAWDRIAAGYDRTHPPKHPLPEKGLRLAGLQAGMRFLDVAAGSGALSIPAARLGASVLATDISPGMLDRLGKRARDEALSVETRAMDGHALDLDDDSFDVVGSQFGVMLFPDMPKGVAEMARVAKPGGRVLLIAFGDVRKVEFFVFLARGIQAVRPDFRPPLDPPPLPFQLQDPERLRREFTCVGLKDVRVEMTTERGLGGVAGVQQSDRRGDFQRARPDSRGEGGDRGGGRNPCARAHGRRRPGHPDRADQYRHRDQVSDFHDHPRLFSLATRLGTVKDDVDGRPSPTMTVRVYGVSAA